MKKILGRVIIILPAIALQVLWYVLLFTVIDTGLGGHLGDIITVVFTLLAFLFVIFLVSKRQESTYKLAWVILIMGFPILGAMLFLRWATGRRVPDLRKSWKDQP